MKSILLTTTALVAFAGAAAADGHVSMSWSGTATAGVAREGGVDAVEVDTADALISLLEELDGEDVEDEDFRIDAIGGVAVGIVEDIAQWYGGTLSDDEDADVAFAENLAAARAAIARDLSWAETALEAGTITSAQYKAIIASLNAHVATGAALFGTTEVPTGDFEEYAEINATVTGSVTLNSGTTVSASMSVDAGRGYDFADDDGFDSTTAQGGSVGFDNVTVDAGAYGTLVINPNDIAHLVDDDDDASADIMYTNDFGVASVAFVMDVDKDTDVAPTAQSWELAALDNTGEDFDEFEDAPAGALGDPYSGEAYTGAIVDENYYLVYNPAVAADVQWSAKVSAPVADIATVYAAFDEEGGYDVGGSATVAGVTIDAKVKSEALAVEQEKDPEFDVHASYSVSGLTVGAGWNSVKDDNQWRIGGSYSMDAITVAASTNEGEEWEVTGSYELSDNASLEAGVNYTEDAYVGVRFNF